jgi:hypothetical protein
MAPSPTTCRKEIYSAIGRCPSNQPHRSGGAEALIGAYPFTARRSRPRSQKVDDPAIRLSIGSEVSFRIGVKYLPRLTTGQVWPSSEQEHPARVACAFTSDEAVRGEMPVRVVRIVKPKSTWARHRDRRRKGLNASSMELCETEIDVLIRPGRFAGDSGGDLAAVRTALYGFLDDHLR